MGAAGSKTTGAFVHNSKRFYLKEVTVHVMEDEDNTNELACGQMLLKAEFDREAESFTLSRPDGRPCEYVELQDLFMPKLPSHSNLAIKFRMVLLTTPNSPFRNVTFLTGSTQREVDSFISTELLENPNIQNEDNVDLLGDFFSRSDAPDIISHTFIYPLADIRKHGRPIHYCFCEYVKSNHSLQPLASGFFYLPERDFVNSQIDILSPDNTLSPVRDLPINPREVPLLSQPQPPQTQGAQGAPAPAGAGAYQSPLTAAGALGISANGAPLSQIATNASAQSRLGPQTQHADQLEDGPLFRSKVQAMERRNTHIKAQVKVILKRAIVLHEQFKETADSLRWFMSGISNASKTGVPSLDVLGPILSDRSFGLAAVRNLLLTITAEFAALVVAPLRDFYERDIKPLEFRKKEFEEVSSQYYSWITRYLGTKRERKDKATENDAKYVDKRTQFELARFDYYNALMDVHGGRRLEQFVLQIAVFSQRWSELTSGLALELGTAGRTSIDSLVEELKQANKDWARHSADREDKRRGLERGMDMSLLDFDQTQTFDEPEPSRYERQDDLPHKEGLLWALSRPGGTSEAQNLSKQGIKWHKYWVVQDGGKLWEYANWKQGMDLHNEPIDLKVARVRETSPADRRFCFEIVTPTYKRVYQTTSDEEVKSWLAYINKGISSSLERYGGGGGTVGASGQGAGGQGATGSASQSYTPSSYPTGASGSSTTGHSAPSSYPATPSDLSVIKPRDTIEKLGENIGRKLSLKTKGRNIANSSSTSAAMAMAGSPGALQSPVATTSLPPVPSKSALMLLNQLQRAPSNRQCAECEATRGVEWVSINLLVLICIDCSGSHRSLGSHISKVRSLTLDTGFSRDLIEALSSVDNSRMNAVWEARLNGSKPAVTERTRLQFITEKYVEKAFISEIDKPNAFLRRAIQEQNLVDVCTALAARANPNSASDEGEPLLVYALRTAPLDATVFSIAEVLLLNRATVPSHIPDGLSTAAQNYLKQRTAMN